MLLILHDRDLIILQYWKDEFLVWNPSEFNNITMMHIPANKIWKPDILVYNKYVIGNYMKFHIFLKRYIEIVYYKMTDTPDS